ncbi:MAG: aromatic-ring-hydroxylating dioxygenase subunit beta [Burkholderiales bacterium]|nr:aromatic-ring-hydroxylating dioxygenase subunit beta [Burkholderiales bacterium]
MNTLASSAPQAPAAGSLSSFNDDGRYLDAARLQSAEAFAVRMSGRSDVGVCGPAELHRVEQFLYHEARLLDARRYRDWFELLTDDFVYWIPSTWGRASLHDDVSVNFDDRRRILDRIAFTTSGVQIAQMPPSRTLRSLSNVQAWPGEEGGFEVAAGITIWSHRRKHTVSFIGHLRAQLALRGDSFAIRTRIIELLDCDEPQGNNSFIL